MTTDSSITTDETTTDTDEVTPATVTEARAALSSVGIDDPTDNLVNMAREVIDGIRSGLAEDPTMSDYDGAVSDVADSAAAGMGLDEIHGSLDALRYDHGMGDGGENIERAAELVSYAIASNIAHEVYGETVPDPLTLPWDRIPTTNHGGYLVGRYEGDGPMWIEVRFPSRNRGTLSICGSTMTSGGQIDMHVKPEDVDPAPGFTSHEVRGLFAIWGRFHLVDGDSIPADVLDYLARFTSAVREA